MSSNQDTNRGISALSIFTTWARTLRVLGKLGVDSFARVIFSSIPGVVSNTPYESVVHVIGDESRFNALLCI